MARPNKRKLIRKAIPNSERLKVIERDRLHCIQCGKQLELNGEGGYYITFLEGNFHHIIPLIYGGPNISFNICSLCTDCHIKVHSGDESKQKYINMYSTFISTGQLF
ncbi:HNH endonuclease [Sporomusa ovata]|uniref:HNH endonuclease n=1 Tax=Sporomusa ovata TaxID=2378 RepID=UPI00041F7FF0|nr:HNH endonuclease [Sporomusa ovata]